MSDSNRIVPGCYSQEEIDKDWRIAELEAEVARLNREVRKWQSRRMVAEQKLGYEEKLRARAEADPE
jgi:hypothetical protein